MILMRMELNLTSNVNMVLMSALEIRWQNIVCYVRIQLQVLACALWFVEEPAVQVPFMECLASPYFDWSQNYWVRKIPGMPGIAFSFFMWPKSPTGENPRNAWLGSRLLYRLAQPGFTFCWPDSWLCERGGGKKSNSFLKRKNQVLCSNIKSQGADLLFDLGVETKSLDPPLLWVPWTTFNGVEQIFFNKC